MAILELREISKRFGALQVLSGIDLDVEEGKITSVIGPNGAGKTTLFNVITARFPLDAGSVRFRGEEIGRKRSHDIAMAGLARSFQITNIFPRLTVHENVALAAQVRSRKRYHLFSRGLGLSDVEARASAILERIGLAGQADRPAGKLSHGDQRHLEIAMTLATGPGLLLLDEPTSGMSSLESASTMELIRELRRDVTVLIIEHDMDLVMGLSDRIVVLNFGQKIAEGTPEEVSRDPEVRRVYLGGA
jgi:branched-chain amino acid transport system ATP-binding protein